MTKNNGVLPVIINLGVIFYVLFCAKLRYVPSYSTCLLVDVITTSLLVNVKVFIGLNKTLLGLNQCNSLNVHFSQRYSKNISVHQRECDSTLT